MIYEHQKNAIEFITQKFQADINVDALLISGSIAHDFNSENSDIDINIIVNNEFYKQKESERALTYWEDAGEFYEGGYYDGKFITLDYLSLVAERGNEPTRFALHDSRIAFDKTGQVAAYLEKIGAYPQKHIQENTVRFISQLDAWKWYCNEAIKKGNQYLLELSVSKMILFGGRLILLDNRILYPYHKWFLKVLENAPNKPSGLVLAIKMLLKDKSPENIEKFYELVKKYKDWTNGEEYSWSNNFLLDVETVWMRENDFIENI